MGATEVPQSTRLGRARSATPRCRRRVRSHLSPLFAGRPVRAGAPAHEAPGPTHPFSGAALARVAVQVFRYLGAVAARGSVALACSGTGLLNPGKRRNTHVRRT